MTDDRTTSGREPRGGTPFRLSFDLPALREVERRRNELFGVTFFLVVGFAVGMVLLSFVEQRPDWLDPLGESINFVRAGVFCLALAFVTYVFNHERNLRRLSHELVNERVLGAALSNRLREIASLAEAGSFIIPGGRFDTVVDSILAAAFELLEADSGSLMLVRDSEFELVSATGNAAQYKGSRRSMADGIAGYVARTRRPVVIQGAAQLDEYGSLIERADSLLSSLSVPLLLGADFVGVMSLNVTSGIRRYNEYDARALMLFAEHAASVIQMARLFDDNPNVRAAVAELDRARRDLLRSAPATGETFGAPVSQPRRGRVLIAEDDPAMLRLLQTTFESSGYEVLLASDGETALSRTASEEPDVLLLDLVLPVLDGWGVMERLQDARHRPRIVCLTGKATSRDRYNAWNLGADEYVEKPFELGKLLATVEEVCERSDEERAERRQKALKDLLGRS